MVHTVFRVLIFAILVSACSVPAATPLATTSPPELGETWTLKMEHTGGIMGLSRSIEISSDGEYTVTDKRTNKSVKGELSAAELGDLQELVGTSTQNSIPEGRNSGCADCFVYSIEIKGAADKPFTVVVDDTTIADSGLEPLVTFLRGIIDKSLK